MYSPLCEFVCLVVKVILDYDQYYSMYVFFNVYAILHISSIWWMYVLLVAVRYAGLCMDLNDLAHLTARIPRFSLPFCNIESTRHDRCGTN